jgi:hypothetical protein
MGIEMSILIDPDFSCDDLRQTLFAGNLVILTRLRALTSFVEYTKEQLAEVFKPYDPEDAHENIDPSEMAEILGRWKPRFIHAEKSKKLVRAVIEETGFPAGQTHYDLPKPRTSFPVGHLTTGMAFAFPWHRDVWYSAPAQQINWWLPIFPVRDDNAMSFDLASFDQPVPNSSDTFDYYQNNASRFTTASQVTRERQARPGALNHTPSQELTILPAPGEVLLFSGAQLHASIPNTSGRARFSVDFRTVYVPDLMTGCGAPLVDAHCTGTSIRDFINVADERSFDEQLVRDLFGAPPEDALLVFGAPDQKALPEVSRGAAGRSYACESGISGASAAEEGAR